MIIDVFSQDEVIRRLVSSGALEGASPPPESRRRHEAGDEREWTFAKAFLYSLTLLTTIGKFLSTPEIQFQEA